MPLALTGAGAGSPGGSGGGAPTVAPNLYLIEIQPGGSTPTLHWTASNRTDSPGFRYEIWYEINGSGLTYLGETQNLSYSQSFSPSEGTFNFQIRPVNNAGEGPSSNTASVNIPGEV